MAASSLSVGQRIRSQFTARQQQPTRKQASRCQLGLEVLEARDLPSALQAIGNVFYILMENHNLTQPSAFTPNQLLGNPAAPYLNSLITPGNPNAAQTSYALNYFNALFSNPSISVHPSEPNYIFGEDGIPQTNLNTFSNPNADADPYTNYPNNLALFPHLTGLLQAAGIPWKSYAEDIDLLATSGTVNQPGANALTSTVAPQSQWTVPLISFNNGKTGPDPNYVNPYNGSNFYDYGPKHVGPVFFPDTNGSGGFGPNFSPSNPETQFYAPLQQLQIDLMANTLARYNMITPDQYNDMHTGLPTGFTYNGVTFTGDQAAVAQGDNFLSKIIPMIMASQAYKNNGAIVIWYDETEGPNTFPANFNANTTQFTLPEILISPLAKGNAFASSLTYTHSSDLKTLQELFNVGAPGFLGDANTQGTNDLSDFFKPTTQYFAVGAALGGGPQVNVYNAVTGQIVASFFAFSPSFSGGVRVAVDDINGDGIPDIICAAGPGAGPQIEIIDGSKLSQVQSNGQIANSAIIASFFAFNAPSFAGGVYVAAGTSATGQNWVAVGAGSGASPQVAIYTSKAIMAAAGTGATPAALTNFFAFAPTFAGGVSVALGDVNGDGKLDVIVGAGPGGGPQVIVVDGTKFSQISSTGTVPTGALLASFFAFAPTFNGGVWVSGGYPSPGQFSLIVGAGPGGSPQVLVINGALVGQTQSNGQIANNAVLSNFLALPSGFSGGVRVGFSASFGSGGTPAILTGAGPGGGAEVAPFNALTFQSLTNFFAFPGFTNGLFVAG
jgi:hypothetical protein